MGDVAEKLVGNRKYFVYGLQAKAEEIRGQARALSEGTTTRLDAARTALTGWSGPHSTAFCDRLNPVLASVVSLRLDIAHAAARCEQFPAEPATMPSAATQYDYMGTKVYATDNQAGVSSATPDKLRAYVTAAFDQIGKFRSAAGKVTTSGLTAKVSVQRSLTSEERSAELDQGTPDYEVDTMTRWSEPEPVEVSQVFGLPNLSDRAGDIESDFEGISDWTTAVAWAFQHSDQKLLQLLLDHPEIAGYFADGLTSDGRMTGEAALVLLLANFGQFDIAAHGGNPDGVVGLEDLRAILNNASLPQYLRDAAGYLINNRLLLSQVSIINERYAFETRPDNATLTAEGISLFLQYNHSVKNVALGFNAFDTAAEGGDPDGFVSVEDLRAAADDTSLPQEMRDAAAFLLAHPMLVQRIRYYEYANATRASSPGGEMYMQNNLTGFYKNGVIALAIDQQAFPDPAEARQFVMSLPVADRNGNGGLSIQLVSDEGVKALANSALLDARGDITDTHGVIAHLPETTSWPDQRGAVTQHGGVRNTLITAFYNELAQRADGIFAGDMAGHPEMAGHPGASWLTFAPWASTGIRGVITGDTTGPFGITTTGVQQGAADGNQFLFYDVGSRFAAFVELYENNPHPSETQLENFFSSNFGPGDGTLRDGFAAYVAAVEEPDPVRKQHLMFQANTLAAVHEQAGVQPYIEKVMAGPDSIATDYVELQMGDSRLQVTNDVPGRNDPNNHIVPASYPGLDPGSKTAASFPAGGTRFSIGGTETSGTVDMRPLGGVEEWRPGYTKSTYEMWDHGSGDAHDPESLHGSDASSWADWNERMNYISRLFEQNHTNRTLWETNRISADMNDVTWLDPDAVPR